MIRLLPQADTPPPWAQLVWRYLTRRRTQGWHPLAACRATGLCRRQVEIGYSWLVAARWVKLNDMVTMD